MNVRVSPTRLPRRGLQVLRRKSRYLLLLLLGLTFASIMAASPARSDDRAIGIPGIDLCKKVAPLAVAPVTGTAGWLGERPIHITTDDSPGHIWTTGGFAGFQREPYDLGCASNPATYLKMAKNNANNWVTNSLIGAGEMVTALTDSIDRRAWSPTWVTAFLGDFAQRAIGTIQTAVLVPLLGIGLMAATIMLLVKHRGGDMGGAATSVAWTLFVLVILAGVMASPVFASKMGQDAGSATISVLNNGADASDSQTNHIVEAVQYQSWLRRNFGSQDSTAARQWGPQLLMSQRITWAELDQINKDPTNSAKALADLRKQKSDDFKRIAKFIKEDDPDAYRWLSGENDASGMSIVEVLYSMVASFFRLAVDLLMVTCAIMLTVLALCWPVATPYLVTPAGKQLGISMLNNTVRGAGYVITAAVGSWMFGVYMQVCLQPGQSAWWSIILLFLGTIVAWTMIRPDRKMLSLMSMGHVHGTGKIMKTLGKLAMAYVGGRVAGAAAARVIREDEPAVEQDRSEDQTWNYHPDPVTFGTIDPTEDVVRSTSPGIEASASWVDAEDVSETLEAGRGLPRGAWSMPAGTRAIGPSQPIYQRADVAEPVDAEEVDFVPPPEGAVGEVEIYQRPVSEDPEDQYVTCPWCNGAGCGHCEHTGVVPLWVRNHVMSDDN